MPKLPKRFFLESQGKINDIVAESFPDATEQRELPALKDKKSVLITFAWELSSNQICQLKNCCNDSNINFDAQVWVKCGDHFIRPARNEEWDKSYKKRQTRKKRIQRSIGAFVVSHGKFPHRIG